MHRDGRHDRGHHHLHTPRRAWKKWVFSFVGRKHIIERRDELLGRVGVGDGGVGDQRRGGRLWFGSRSGRGGGGLASRHTYQRNRHRGSQKGKAHAAGSGGRFHFISCPAGWIGETRSKVKLSFSGSA